MEFNACPATSEVQTDTLNSAPCEISLDDDANIVKAANVATFSPSCGSDYRRQNSTYSDFTSNSEESYDHGGFSFQRSPVFQDAEEIKRTVRQFLTTPRYDVTQFYHQRGIFQLIARSLLFEYVTLVMIVLNSIWLAVQTNANRDDWLYNSPEHFIVIENLFCTYFLLEVMIRILAYRDKSRIFRDLACLSDAGLVLVTMIEVWLMPLFMTLLGRGSSTGSNIIRVVRLMRIVRLARIARLFRGLPELSILVKGLLAAVRSVFLTFGLAIIVTYIFAIGFTELMSDSDVGSQFFPDVQTSMMTLMTFGLFLDNVGMLVSQLAADSTIGLVAFLLFAFLTTFTLMNMMIGVLCQVVTDVAEAEKEDVTLSLVRNKLAHFVKNCDENGDKLICRSEFEQLLKHDKAIQTLHGIGVELEALVDLADVIFHEEGSGHGNYNKLLKFSELIQVLLSLRGSNTASLSDLLALKRSVHKMVIEEIKAPLELRLNNIDENVRRLMEHIGMPCKSISRNSIKNASFCSQPGPDAQHMRRRSTNRSDREARTSGASVGPRARSAPSFKAQVECNMEDYPEAIVPL